MIPFFGIKLSKLNKKYNQRQSLFQKKTGSTFIVQYIKKKKRVSKGLVVKTCLALYIRFVFVVLILILIRVEFYFLLDWPFYHKKQIFKT